MLPAQFEIGEYTTSDGQVLSIYVTYRKGGIDPCGSPVEPAYGFNLDIDGQGKLWFWLDWAAFIEKINELAGEVILSADDNPFVLADNFQRLSAEAGQISQEELLCL